MDYVDHVTFVIEHHFVLVGIGAIGVVLGVSCLYLRHKDVEAPWARRLCLFSDILNTTFVSITVVGVLTVSFQLAIHLPDLARAKDIPGEVDLTELNEGQTRISSEIAALGGSIPPPVNLSGLAKGQTGNRQGIERLGKLIQDLSAQLERRDLYTTIGHLDNIGQLNENSLTNAVRGVLGDMIRYPNVKLHVRHERAGSWYCHSDGGLQCRRE
jgi:hypothetical protein